MKVLATPARLLMLWGSLCLFSGQTVADEGSGCPAYGCLPSGSFALSSDIPGTGNEVVGVRWSTPISLTTLTPPAVRPSRLGCVTCQAGIVCPTHSGYVSVDQMKGELVWRYDNMTSPSLPVLDIYGDVIGTDGKHLVKIDADGQVQHPVIKIYYHLAPMYSIKLANDNLFLMTSRVSGELITYAVNGIPEASLTLHDVVERVNGSFFPVAQPVIYGKRAYILMQFVPDFPQPQQAHAMGLQRLYAVDLWARMAERISPVWYVNFERMACPPGRDQAGVTMPTNNVLVHNNTAYVSIGRPEAGCGSRRGRGDGSSSQEEGMLWAIHDNGTEPEVLFKVPAPVSTLSLYDVDLDQQNVPAWDKGMAGFPRRKPKVQRPNNVPKNSRTANSSAAETSGPLLWAAASQQITGYNSRNGSVECVIDVSKLLNVPCRITSKVMVARSKDGKWERLVFAMSETGNLTSRNDSSTSFVVAATMEVGSDDVQLMWKVAVEPGTEVVGQIANMLFMPPAASRGKTTAERKGSNSNQQGGDRGGDDLEVLLVGTAVNETSQYSFALGRL